MEKGKKLGGEHHEDREFARSWQGKGPKSGEIVCEKGRPVSERKRNEEGTEGRNTNLLGGEGAEGGKVGGRGRATHFFLQKGVGERCRDLGASGG